MRALILVDRFFTERVFEEVVKNIPFWGDVERIYYTLPWPDCPLCEDEEVTEFIAYPREVMEEIPYVEIVITQMGKIDAALLRAGEKLRVVACLRSGPVNINVALAQEMGIPVFCVPDRSAQAVAEFALGLMLTCWRRVFQADRELRGGQWTQCAYFTWENAPPPFSECTVGLFGFGHVARALARLLKGLECRIISFDPYVDGETMRNFSVEKVSSLEDFLSQADIVSLHLRGKKGEMVMGKKEFSFLKKGAIFINTSRGKLVDEKAFVAALREGRLSCAALDTFPKEPWVGDSPFLELDNVIVTPHIAGASRSTARRGAQVVAQLVADYFSGKEISECFWYSDPKKGDSFRVLSGYRCRDNAL